MLRKFSRPQVILSALFLLLVESCCSDNRNGSIFVAVDALSSPPPQQQQPSISRRDLLYGAVGVGGAAIYGKLVSDAVGRLSRGDLVYPSAHEDRVAEVIRQSMEAAVAASSSSTLRILEVGMGKDCRVIRRGLYQSGLQSILSSPSTSVETSNQSAKKVISNLELVGMDISPASDQVVALARDRLQQTVDKFDGISSTLDFRTKSITETPSDLTRSNGEDPYFDVVLCFLTLCSVDDPDRAISEIRHLVRPNGGVFGYVEHVAVNSSEMDASSSSSSTLTYKVLDWQQKVFDPLQQILAENCHLHRSTDESIDRIFGAQGVDPSSTRWLSRERFLVSDMWPVSCQALGVLQRLS